MADDKKKTATTKDAGTTAAAPPAAGSATTTANAASTAGGFDYEAFFKAAGVSYTKEDMRDMSSLIPMYSFEEAWEQKWGPVFGKLITRRRILVDKTEEDPEKANRWFYLVELKHPTMALKGTGENRQPAVVKKGELIYWPESGSLKNREELQRVAEDPRTMFDVFFRVEGEPQDLGKKGRNPMWPIEAQLCGNGYAREGRYVIGDGPQSVRDLPSSSNGRQLSGAPGELPAGNMFAGQAQPRQ